MADSSTLLQVITRSAEMLKGEGKPVGDTTLKELANDAFDAIKLYFQARGATFIRAETDVTVTAGQTTIDSTNQAALFAVMQRPVQLFEKPTGTSSWVPMRLVPEHLPYNVTQSDRLSWWNWEGGKIKLPGATVDVSVRVRYMGDPASLSLPTDSISYPDLVAPLAHMVCSAAQGGNEYHEKTAAKLLELISRVDGRINQQRPFRRTRRIFGLPYRRY